MIKKFATVLLGLTFCASAFASNWKVCHPINGKLFCIDIPCLINPEFIWDPPYRHPDLDPRILEDLSYLALIDRLAGRLSAEVGAVVRAGVNEEAQNMGLPSGFELVQSQDKLVGATQWSIQYSLREASDFQVPIALAGYGYPGPDPQPWSELDPDPTSWLVMEGLSQQVVSDLALLATMNALTAQMQTEAGANLAGKLQDIAAGFALPATLTLSF